MNNELLSGITFETFKDVRLVTVICLTVIVDEGQGKAQAVCRFFSKDGTFLCETPAKNITNVGQV